MSRREIVGSICWRFDSDSGDEDGPELIQYVDGRDPQVHEVWNFGEDGVTREVHPIARVDVGDGFVGEFMTNDVTPSWCRVPMFGVHSINGSVQWLVVPATLRTDEPP